MPVVGSDPGKSERDRLWRQAHDVIFTTGVTVQQWLPSQRVIKLDCIVVKQIPPCTIAASPERFLTTFLTRKDAIADPSETNNRMGVPSRGAADIGRDQRSWPSA